MTFELKAAIALAVVAVIVWRWSVYQHELGLAGK